MACDLHKSPRHRVRCRDRGKIRAIPVTERSKPRVRLKLVPENTLRYCFFFTWSFYTLPPSFEEVLRSVNINGRDNDFLRDLLRERIQSLLNNASLHVPTAEESREMTALLAEIDVQLARHAAFVRDRILPLQTALRDAGLAPIDLAAEPPKPKVDEIRDEHAARRGDESR